MQASTASERDDQSQHLPAPRALAPPEQAVAEPVAGGLEGVAEELVPPAAPEAGEAFCGDEFGGAVAGGVVEGVGAEAEEWVREEEEEGGEGED